MYLAPFPCAPLDGTIPDIAVSSVGGRWLRTHVIWNEYCFAGAVCHLVDAGNVTCLYTNTARAHACREFAIVPPADADNDTFVRKDNVEIRGLYIRHGIITLFVNYTCITSPKFI